MAIRRVGAILLQEFYITKNSLEVIIDLFYFSIINIVLFGFVSLFLAKSVGSAASYYLFLGMILWEVVRVTQYSTTVGVLWNIWSKNLSNMFVSPLTLTEYVVALFISSVIKSVLIFFIISMIALLLFDFNIYSVGFINLIIFYINLTIFSWSAGIILLGFIFRFGQRIQALAWGIIFLFQPLTAALFPLKFLPDFLQKIAFVLPPTYVFEGAREALGNQKINFYLAGISFIENIVYFILAWLLFKYLYNKARENGQFARNEG